MGTNESWFSSQHKAIGTLCTKVHADIHSAAVPSLFEKEDDCIEDPPQQTPISSTLGKIEVCYARPITTQPGFRRRP
jgi:hypothetical protein